MHAHCQTCDKKLREIMLSVTPTDTRIYIRIYMHASGFASTQPIIHGGKGMGTWEILIVNKLACCSLVLRLYMRMQEGPGELYKSEKFLRDKYIDYRLRAASRPLPRFRMLHMYTIWIVHQGRHQNYNQWSI